MLSTIECVLCQAQSEGLVRYPAAQAPKTFVWLDCADHAHLALDSRWWVECNSDGSWETYTLRIPACECDEGYREVSIDDLNPEIKICEG